MFIVTVLLLLLLLCDVPCLNVSFCLPACQPVCWSPVLVALQHPSPCPSNELHTHLHVWLLLLWKLFFTALCLSDELRQWSPEMYTHVGWSEQPGADICQMIVAMQFCTLLRCQMMCSCVLTVSGFTDEDYGYWLTHRGQIEWLWQLWQPVSAKHNTQNKERNADGLWKDVFFFFNNLWEKKLWWWQAMDGMDDCAHDLCRQSNCGCVRQKCHIFFLHRMRSCGFFFCLFSADGLLFLTQQSCIIIMNLSCVVFDMWCVMWDLLVERWIKEPLWGFFFLLILKLLFIHGFVLSQ